MGVSNCVYGLSMVSTELLQVVVFMSNMPLEMKLLVLVLNGEGLDGVAFVEVVLYHHSEWGRDGVATFVCAMN